MTAVDAAATRGRSREAMIFGNPVKGVVHPEGWVQPKDSREFRVTQPFGGTKVDGEPPFGKFKRFHRGQDLGNKRCGAAVFAAQAGKVQFEGLLGNGEVVVVLDHGGGWGSSYGHLARSAVSKGQALTKGQRIGDVGATGMAIGCHLHFAIKSGLPKSFTRLAFIPNPMGGTGDTVGKWRDPWPLLEQNVKVHPRADVPEIRIRTEPKLDAATLFATTSADGRIQRAADGADLGPVATWRDWGGQVKGASYTINGQPGDMWERIALDGSFRFIASPLAVLSAT
jgi:murein DD-endopeptidase MepM/ murein hydrolase activator NlpD